MTALPFGRAGLALAAVCLLCAFVLPQSGDAYDLTWSTVDGGGTTLITGGGYTLGGTIGQPDAGMLTGGDYALGGGFLSGGAPTAGHDIFLPLVIKRS